MISHPDIGKLIVNQVVHLFQVYVKTGEIGDRKLIVKSSSDTGSEPTLEIIKKFKIGTLTKDKYFPGNELVDKITYINTD